MSNYILTSLDGLDLGSLMTYGWLDARICHGLQAVDEFNDVVPKEIALICIDFRSSSLHFLVATDATFFSDELDYIVDDVDGSVVVVFVHLYFSFRNVRYTSNCTYLLGHVKHVMVYRLLMYSSTSRPRRLLVYE